MLVPILQNEDKVQVGDKTRLNAVASFATKGVTAISTLTLKPDLATTAVNIFNADPKNWFLDWVYSDASFDLDSTYNTLYVKLNGSEQSASVPAGNYSFSALAAAIQTALNTLTGGTFTVAIDNNDKLTVSCTSSFTIQAKKPLANLWPSVGFMDETSQATSHEGSRIEGGIKKMTLTAGNGVTTAAKDFYIKVMTKEGDHLFSKDEDLTQHEPDIRNYAEKGRVSHLNLHRRSQDQILNWLYQNGYTSSTGKKLTKFAIVDNESVRLWSAYLCLYLIFMSLQNANDDVFKEKAQWYEKLYIDARNQAILELDTDENGDSEEQTKVSTWSGEMVRR